MTLRYPDLGRPPDGWTAAKTGNAIRLVPPGAYADRARAFMVVSPLVPVQPTMPEVETLLRQTLAAEVASTGMTIEEAADAETVHTTTGLSGTRLAVIVRLAGRETVQRRIYTMYHDSAFLYGLHYIADDGTFDHFLETYQAAAASIEPAAP